MRRAFVVLVLLAMMVGLRALKTDAAGNADPLTLAAIGFVVLAAFAVAELGNRVGLPKVTGYIVTGVVCGPFVLNVLSNDVVEEMSMFTKLALGLIAVTAGLELDLKGLRSLTKTLVGTVGIKLVTGVVFVGGVLVAGELLFSALGLDGTGSMMALALVFGALSVGTSPAISLAILSESGAKGRLSELILGAAVVKDVVVVVLLAVAVAVAKGLIGPEAGHAVEGAAHGAAEASHGGFGASMLHVGEELGRTILAGAVLGVVLILYLRYVRAEMLVFVTAMVLVVVELSDWFHLELLLVFIVAGLIVRNFSEHGEDLLHPLETVSLPVFIVFFANAGASVNLEATVAVLPLAIAMGLARAGGFVVAGRLGGRVGGEPDNVRTNAWLGYLPQAGVTLGLVGVAATQLPQLSSEIKTLGMALVALNLLVGPVTLRLALRRAGEIPEGHEGVDDEGVLDETEAVEDPGGGSFELRPWERLESKDLQALAQTIADHDRAAIRDCTQRIMRPWIARLSKQLNLGPLEAASTRKEALLAVRDAVESVRPDTGMSWIEGTIDVHRTRCEALAELPSQVTVQLEDAWRRPGPDDGFVASARKRLARIGDALRLRFRDRRRSVPIRMIARTRVEIAFARALEEAVRGGQRLEARILEELHRCTLGTREPADTVRAIRTHVDTFVDTVREDLEVASRRCLADVVEDFERVGSPVHPANTVRYSSVEPELRRWHDRMYDDAKAWPARRDAAGRLVLVTNELSQAELHLDNHVRKSSLDLATDAFDQVREEVEAQRRRLQQVMEHLEGVDKLDAEALERLTMEVGATLPRPVQKKLRVSGTKVRRATSAGFASGLLREANIRQGGKETLVQSLGVIIEAERPATVPLVTFDVGENLQGFMSATLVPKLDELLSETWSTFGASVEAMRTALAAAEFAVSSAVPEGTDGASATTPGQLHEQLEQVDATLESSAASAFELWDDLRRQILEELSNMDEQFGDFMALAAGRGTGGQASTPTAWALRWGPWLREYVGDPVRKFLRQARARIRGEAEHGLGRQYRLRSGAERADAADVRELIARNAVQDDRLPQIYRALFSQEAVRDPRLYVAHRAQLNEVVRAERAWLNNTGGAGNAVLVTGPSGSGKTSLLQVARLKLSSRNVVAAPPREEDNAGMSLMQMLGRELGAPPEPEGLRDALLRRRGTVVIDDLQGWLPLGSVGMRELDRFLNLVVETRTKTMWIVSMPAELLEAIERVVPVRPAFDRVVALGPVGAEAFDRVVESRQSLSGFALVFPEDAWSRWLGWISRKSPRETYIEGLLVHTRGTMRRSLHAWTRRAQYDENHGQIVLEAQRVEWDLPLRSQLTATQLAELTLLLRAGARSPEELARALSLPDAHVARDLHFLRGAGLVKGREGRQCLAPALRDEVAAALTDLGAMSGGAQ